MLKAVIAKNGLSSYGRLREECLRVSWFTNLFDTRRKVTNWKAKYNEQRPHSSLGYRTPAEFASVVITPSMEKTWAPPTWKTPQEIGRAHV